MLTLSQFFQSCCVLPDGWSEYTSKAQYLSQFKQMFGSEMAKKASGVVYVFVCDKKIPRVKGESEVVYIGQTKQNLCDRWMMYAEVLCEENNWSFFSYIIEHYGTIGIAYLRVEERKKAETDLLNDYYKHHKEYPPHNCQRR